MITKQTMSVRKNEVAGYLSNGWIVSESQLSVEENILGLIAIEKDVPADSMLRGNAQWWKL